MQADTNRGTTDVSQRESNTADLTPNVPPDNSPDRDLQWYRLGDDEKDEVKAVVCILDQCGISMAAYRKMTQALGRHFLPKSHLVQSFKKDMTSDMEISKTPGRYSGAEINLLDTLRADEHIVRAEGGS